MPQSRTGAAGIGELRRALPRRTVDLGGPMIDAQNPLLTDLYQLAMLQGHHAHGMTKTAAFELFVRKLPSRRGFLMAAGLEQVLDFL
jgi:hypothetical protein